MKTQDIVRRLWDEAGHGNIAVWTDDTITLVPQDYKGETDGRKPVAILKPIALVNKYDFLDFALADEERATFACDVPSAGDALER